MDQKGNPTPQIGPHPAAETNVSSSGTEPIRQLQARFHFACPAGLIPVGPVSIADLRHVSRFAAVLAWEVAIATTMSDHGSVDWIQDLYAELPKMIEVPHWASAEDIAVGYRKWIGKLATATEARSGRITPSEASRLLFMINLVLDFIECACDCRRLEFSALLGLLYPVEDILVGLRLVEHSGGAQRGEKFNVQ